MKYFQYFMLSLIEFIIHHRENNEGVMFKWLDAYERIQEIYSQYDLNPKTMFNDVCSDLIPANGVYHTIRKYKQKKRIQEIQYSNEYTMEFSNGPVNIRFTKYDDRKYNKPIIIYFIEINMYNGMYKFDFVGFDNIAELPPDCEYITTPELLYYSGGGRYIFYDEDKESVINQCINLFKEEK